MVTAVIGNSNPAESLEDEAFELQAYGLEDDLFDHLGGEGISEEPLGRIGGEPTAPGVEKGDVVQPADGGAVRALHVVGEDLELGLGVHPGVIAPEEIAVGLLGVGLLRLGAHEHLTVEDRARPAVEHTL